MKYFDKKYHLIYAFAVITIFFSSCRKFVETEKPVNLIDATAVFNSNATATAALSDNYFSILVNYTGSSGISYLAGLSADELTNYSGEPQKVSFYSNNLNAATDFGWWPSFYHILYEVNQAIEQLQVSTGVSNNVKQELLGEAKFTRAFCDFYLVNFFGDVPLINTTDYKVNMVATRTLSDAVYAQIITDLTEASQELSDNYIGNDGSSVTTERVRPNKWAAEALLARVYLYKKDWKNAEFWSSNVIANTNLFALTNLNDVFLKNSKEAIWQIMPTYPNTNTYDAQAFVAIPKGDHEVTVSNQLLSAFEANDQRRQAWIGNENASGTDYYYPNKYKIGANVPSPQPVTEYSMVLRLAEQYLIRAEARAELTNTTGAAEDLNMIRTRAGLPNITVTSQEDLLTAIAHERQIELFSEWGNRWLDLKRTGKVDAVMNIVTPLKGGVWKSDWALYPLPQKELLAPGLKGHQNPGY